MKKPTDRWREWHRVRAYNQWRRKNRARAVPRLVRMWHGGDVGYAISEKAPDIPPSIMCLDKNPEPVMDFLEKTRRKMLRPSKEPRWTKRRRHDRYPRIAGFMDFSVIHEMSTAVALVLAAEYERIVQTIGAPPPLINLDQWDADVLLRLIQLGFFSKIGITGELPKLETNGEVMTLQFLSGANAEDTQAAEAMLLELAGFLDPYTELPASIAIPMNSAISEAMINVRRHAYPADHRFRYHHINRWWLTGSADRTEGRLTIVIYDQGATIPVTYPRRKLRQQVLKWIRDQIVAGEDHVFASDGLHIEAAATFGASQTGYSFHGKGLPDMKNAIDKCGRGRLAILSRGGKFVYDGNGKTSRRFFHSSVGGTLIEWTLFLPKGARAETTI